MQSRGRRSVRSRVKIPTVDESPEAALDKASDVSEEWDDLDNSSDDPAYQLSEDGEEDESSVEQSYDEPVGGRRRSTATRAMINRRMSISEGSEEILDLAREASQAAISKRVATQKTAVEGNIPEDMPTASYFQSLNLPLEDSDDSLEDEDLEDLMFGLTDQGGRPRSRRRGRRKKSLFASDSMRAKGRRRSASCPAKRLTPEATVMMQEANNFYLEGNFESCIQKLKKVIADCPGAHDPFHLMGLIYETHFKDIRKAINAYLVAASIIKSDVELWTRIGRLAENADVSAIAIYCYRRVLPSTRNKGEVDEMIALDLARLFFKKLDYHRASIYIQKFFLRHPGDSSVAMEHARCFLKLQSAVSAAIVLEVNLVACLPAEDRDNLFTTDLQKHDWLKNETRFVGGDEASYHILTAHFEDDGVIETDESPEFLPAINWDAAAMYLGICIELGECARASKLCQKLLQRSCGGIEVVDYVVNLELTFSIKYVSVLIRSGGSNHAAVGELPTRLIAKVNDDVEDCARRTGYLNDLADAYFAADEPATALSIYKMSPSNESTLMLAEFRLKAAKCYIRLKDYENAAEFLELLAPTTPSGGLSGIPKCATMDQVVLRMRAVEARLLLRQIYNGEHVTDNKEDEASKVITRDKRLRAMLVNSAIYDIPKKVLAEVQRRVIISRVALHSDLLRAASDSIRCCTEINNWIAAHECDKIDAPLIDHQLITNFLPDQLRPLLQKNFSVADIWAGLAGVTFEKSKSDYSRCANCRTRSCKMRLRRFLSTWRLRICAEYIVLARDAAMDMRRLLIESSRNRAVALTRQIKIQKTMPDEHILPSIEDQSPSQPSSQISAGSDSRGYILKIENKSAALDLRRKLGQAVRRVNNPSLVYHSKLKTDIEIVLLEDVLTWAGYARFLEMGTLLLVEENLPALAIELLECLLLAVRFSRACKCASTLSQRTHFRQRIRRLILRTAVMNGVLRVWLMYLRSRILAPQLWGSTSGALDQAYDRGLRSLGLALFSGTFSHNGLTSIAASTFRDIISFNRAWTIRQTLQHPSHFQLILFLGHFCTLSARFVFAASEYTRAVSLRPASCVASLCLAVGTLAMATSRGIQDRHHVVFRAISAFSRYKKVREAWCDALCQKATKFAQDKVLRIFKSSSDSPEFWKRIENLLNVVSDENADLDEDSNKNPSRRRIILAQLLSCRVTEWVTNYIADLKELCACEILYDEARFYHHINLGHISTPLYEQALKRLVGLKARPAFERVVGELLRIPTKTCPPTFLMRMSHTDFPPALTYKLCDRHAENPIGCVQNLYCKHAQNRTGAVQWPLNVEGIDSLMLAQICEQEEMHSSCLLNFEKLDWNAFIPRASDDILPPGYRIDDPMRGNYENLDVLLEERPTFDVPKIRGVVNATMSKFAANLPPGLHMLTTDRAQLRFCTALNLSAISRGTVTYSYTRAIQRAHICW